MGAGLIELSSFIMWLYSLLHESHLYTGAVQTNINVINMIPEESCPKNVVFRLEVKAHDS